MKQGLRVNEQTYEYQCVHRRLLQCQTLERGNPGVARGKSIDLIQ